MLNLSSPAITKQKISQDTRTQELSPSQRCTGAFCSQAGGLECCPAVPLQHTGCRRFCVRTGAQYGPCLAAVVVAHVRGVSFESALDHMRNIRAITPEPVITRDKCGELFKWLRRQGDSCAAPPLSISLPLQLLASWRERSAIHALAAKSSRAVPQPACRWRQAQEGQRAVFREGVIWIDDILEGSLRATLVQSLRSHVACGNSVFPQGRAHIATSCQSCP